MSCRTTGRGGITTAHGQGNRRRGRCCTARRQLKSLRFQCHHTGIDGPVKIPDLSWRALQKRETAASSGCTAEGYAPRNRLLRHFCNASPIRRRGFCQVHLARVTEKIGGEGGKKIVGGWHPRAYNDAIVCPLPASRCKICARSFRRKAGRPGIYFATRLSARGPRASGLSASPCNGAPGGCREGGASASLPPTGFAVLRRGSCADRCRRGGRNRRVRGYAFRSPRIGHFSRRRFR